MTITRTAPAKVNLTLEILGRREDRYHEIRSVMQAISLHDTLTVHAAPPGVLTLEGGSPAAPPTPDNLVLRAACALQEATDGQHGARISLTKRIPVGAGLGGGSSDAAAALLALNELWHTRIPVQRLGAIGATLGSDVPFFLTDGTALAEGRGERLTPLAPVPPIWLVLAKPAASLRTPDVYGAYAQAKAVPPDRAASSHMVEALRQRASGYLNLSHVASALYNDLEDAAVLLCPEVAAIMGQLSDAGAPGVLLSGSGSTVFALANTEGQARQLAGAVSSHVSWTAVAHTVSLPWKGDDTQ